MANIWNQSPFGLSPFDISPFSEQDAVDAVGPLGPIQSQPMQPMGPMLQPAPEEQMSPLGQILTSPGMAMASQAANNLSALNRGMVPRQTPVDAMREAANQSRMIQMRRAEIVDRQLERANANEYRQSQMANAAAQEERLKQLHPLAMQKAEAALDPASDFNAFVEQRGIGDLPYDEQLDKWRAFQTAGLKASSLPANVQTMMYMEQQLGRPLTEDERWEVLRAPTPYRLGGGGVGIRTPGGSQSVLVTPEDATRRDAEQAGAEQQAKSDVQVATERSEQMRQNETTWAAYQSGMRGLSDALGSTWTGTIGGVLPAVTENQQKTDAAIALMAPLLKNIFREAGEGTFTKDDQEILMAMLPDRGTKGPLVAYIIQQVDNIVRSKLRVDEMDLGGDGDIDLTGMPDD